MTGEPGRQTSRSNDALAPSPRALGERARPPKRSRFRGLQARLLVWFVAAILIAVGVSVVTTLVTSGDTATEEESPTRVMSRHVQQRVAKLWDDPVATEAYVAELRGTTGLDIRVRRDPSIFPGRRAKSSGLVFEDGVAYVPVSKRGAIVGALELRTGKADANVWHVVGAVLAATLVLGAAVRGVSMRLARPLELVAATAEKFGGGDLAARTGVESFSKRWVAEEVRAVGRAFDGMAERVSRVVLEQRELLAAISHELRSPLGRAKVALEIARERVDETAGSGSDSDAGPSAAARALDDVDRQLTEIDTILGDLLASARAGLSDLRRSPIELVSWLEELVGARDVRPVRVVSVGDVKNLRVMIDPALFGRAVHNVLANAWAHGHPERESLVVTVSADESRVSVSVRDRGPGFAPDVLPRAFEPFVTGTGPARSPGAHGTGLGLSLVRRIVEAHAGRISAENVEEEGRVLGALVTLVLPRDERPRD